MIDSIFEEEVSLDRDNLQKIRKDIGQWAKDNMMPYNVQGIIIKRDKELAKKQEKAE